MMMLYPNGEVYHGTNITLNLCQSIQKKNAYLPTYHFLAMKSESQVFFLAHLSRRLLVELIG